MIEQEREEIRHIREGLADLVEMIHDGYADPTGIVGIRTHAGLVQDSIKERAERSAIPFYEMDE